MIMKYKSLTIILVLVLLLDICQCIWMPKEAAEWAVKEFEMLEQKRNSISFKGTDRRSSAPFISGDTFRSVSQHICEDSNRCRMTPEAVKDGKICISI